jgi:hypothetical protein
MSDLGLMLNPESSFLPGNKVAMPVSYLFHALEHNKAATIFVFLFFSVVLTSSKG